MSRSATVSAAGAQLFVTLVLGAVAALAVGFMPDTVATSALSFAAAGALGIYLLSRSPKWAIAGMLFVTIFGLNLFSFQVGPVDVRTIDGFYVALVAWALVRRRTTPAADIGQQYLALLLAVLGASLIPLLAESLGTLTSSMVPWLRLVQTLSLVWLIPRVITEDSDRRFVIGAMECAIALSILRILATTRFQNFVEDRARGDIGPNALGLMAATLVVLALHTHVPRSRVVRVALVGLGLIGLYGAKSVGAFVAVGVVLGIAGISNSHPTWQAAVRPLRIVLLAGLVLVVVGALRETSLPGSAGFEASSTKERLIVGEAGLLLFQQNPLLGVGWQRSSEVSVIGAPDISDQLRSMNPHAPSSFFPDVTNNTVHNTYVQVFAEAGIVGGAALIVVLLVGFRRARVLLRSVEPQDQELARAVLLVVGLVLVWLNDNPLFGAQPETVVLAVAIGLLASFSPARADDADTGSLTAAPVPAAAED